MSKNILMILGHDFLEPFVDPRIYKEAKTLLELGNRVQVLCFSHQTTGEVYEGIDVIRIKRFFNGKKMLKSKSFFAIMLLLVDMPLLYFKAFTKILFTKYEVLHCHDLDTLPLGVVARILKPQKKMIYDSHELALGMPFPRYLIFTIKLTERICLPFVNILITANKERLEIMKRYYPRLLRRKKCFVIYNFPSPVDLNAIKQPEIQRRKAEKKVIFIYQGPLNEDRGIREILRAFSSLKSDNWILIMVGGNVEEVNNFKKTFSNKNFLFTGFIPNNQVLGYMKHANIGILALRNTCLNNYYTAPNKLYEYMQCGCAVLGPDFESTRALIHGNNTNERIGYVTNFDSSQDIGKTLEEILRMSSDTLLTLQKNARNIAGKYTWEQNKNTLKGIYDQ